MALTFAALIEKAGLTKTELANKLDVRKQTVSGWRETPPAYVIEYLNGVIRLKDCQEQNRTLREIIKNPGAGNVEETV